MKLEKLNENFANHFGILDEDDETAINKVMPEGNQVNKYINTELYVPFTTWQNEFKNTCGKKYVNFANYHCEVNGTFDDLKDLSVEEIADAIFNDFYDSSIHLHDYFIPEVNAKPDEYKDEIRAYLLPELIETIKNDNEGWDMLNSKDDNPQMESLNESAENYYYYEYIDPAGLECRAIIKAPDHEAAEELLYDEYIASEDDIEIIDIDELYEDEFNSLSDEYKASKGYGHLLKVINEFGESEKEVNESREFTEGAQGAVESKEGFYVGDICYALPDDIYYDVWGEADYKDGVYEANGFKFAVASTAYGDSEYRSTDSKYTFGVDAGNIGVVPLELASKKDIAELRVLAAVFENPGTAELKADAGYFTITLPNDKIEIDTTFADEYDEEEDDYESGWEVEPYDELVDDEYTGM